MRMVIILIIALLIPDLYIWYHFVRNAHWTMQIIYWLPLVASVILMTLVQTPYYQAWMFRVALSLILIFSVPKFLFMICSIIGWGLRSWLPMAWRVMNGAGMAVSAVTLGVVAYGLFVGWKRLEVNEVTLEFSNLPKGFDGYRIVQLSDLHIGTYGDAPECVDRIVKTVNSIHPDIICFTGDLVNSSSEELDPFMKVLPLMKARDGIYSIMGNHDYCTYRHYNNEQEHRSMVRDLQQRQRSFGWELLLNEHRMIHHNGDSIMLAGVENSSKPPFPDYGDLGKAIGNQHPASTMGGDLKNASVDDHNGQNISRTSSPRGKATGRRAELGNGREGTSRASLFKILLSHDPTHWRRKVLSDTDVELQLSGHTHATQFEIFGWSPASLTYKEWGGLYEMLRGGRETVNPQEQTPSSRKLYVSTGTGGNLAFRFGVYPVIDVITLRCKR